MERGYHIMQDIMQEMTEKQIQKQTDAKKLEPVSTLIPEFTKTAELSEFVDLAKTKNQINAIQREKHKMSNILYNVTDDFDQIVELLKEKGVTTQQIAQMTEEEIDALYVNKNGEELKLNAKFSTKNEETTFKRDFLDMLLENSVRFDEIDQHIASLQTEMDSYNQNIAGLYAETNGDIIAFVRKELEATVAENPDSEYAKGSQEIIDAIEDSYVLESLYQYYTGQKVENTISDSIYRKDDVYNKFVKNCKRTQIITNFKNYDNIEVNFLDEKYHKYPGLFAFAIVKMYAYKKQFTRLEAIWLLQMNANLNLLLIEPTRGFILNDEQRVNRERLIKGMERVLDLFIK